MTHLSFVWNAFSPPSKFAETHLCPGCLLSFKDHTIRDDRDYYNAVKHGLAANPWDWPYMWIEGMKWPKR